MAENTRARSSFTSATSEREDLANFISMITRDETPFMSSIGKTKATAIYHEWQTDELQTPGVGSIGGEGRDYSASNAINDDRTRLGNFTQNNYKELKVSGTKRAVEQAGIADEYAYQLKKRGTELRRDVEFSLIQSGQVRNGGSTTRSMGSVWAYLDAGNVVDAGTGNVTTAYTGAAVTGAGTPFDVPSTAALGALDLTDVDQVMESLYTNGGKATKIMLSEGNRRAFSALINAGTSTNVRRNIDDEGKLRQSIDVYMSDFGDLMVMPNYVMGLSHTATTSGAGASDEAVQMKDFAALIYDPQWFNIATLRPMQEVDVGQQGDSTVGMMVEECTLEVKNPMGYGAIVGLNGS